MSSTKDEFRHESLQDQQSIVKYLNAIAEGITNGKLTVGDDDQQFDLFPQGLLKLEFKAKRKSGKVKLEFEVSWKEKLQDQAEGGPLKIDAGNE
jgi:amphi-Trp domain-containing protein